MWIFCKSGFFSAVKHFDKPDTVHVRARFKGDLERLCKAHGIKPQIDITPDNDYKYRMDFHKDAWSAICDQEANNIDYTNFKNAVHDGTIRDQAYLRVWAAMSNAQH